MKTLPPDVQFRKVPVMFQERWIVLAKVFYTLEALGEEQRLTPEVFTAIHKSGTNLASEKAFFDWAATKGLDRKKVEDMYNSFAVAGKINKAKTEAQQFNVQSVPMIVVDGKFMTATDKVGSHAALPPAINALVAKARAERPKS
jgi:thiol:disulfide interchange protein DsbA